MSNKFKVAGIEYDILQKTQEEMGGHIGQADFNAQEVRICQNFSKQTKKIAIYHEIIHILSDAYGLNLTEDQVRIGTHALLGFLSENPDFNVVNVLDSF